MLSNLVKMSSLLVAILFSCFSFSDVVVVGNPDTPELSKDLARQIFLKKKDLLPNGITAVPIDLTDRHFVKWDFYKQLVGKQPAQMHSYWSRALFNGVGSPPQQVSSAAELQEKLSKIPGAIGYIDEKDVGPKMKVLLRISI